MKSEEDDQSVVIEAEKVELAARKESEVAQEKAVSEVKSAAEAAETASASAAAKTKQMIKLRFKRMPTRQLLR